MLVGGLAGDTEHAGDLGPGRTPMQRPGDEPLKIGFGGADRGDLVDGTGEGIGLETFVPVHERQATLTDAWVVRIA